MTASEPRIISGRSLKRVMESWNRSQSAKSRCEYGDGYEYPSQEQLPGVFRRSLD